MLPSLQSQLANLFFAKPNLSLEFFTNHSVIEKSGAGREARQVGQTEKKEKKDRQHKILMCYLLVLEKVSRLKLKV